MEGTVWIAESLGVSISMLAVITLVVLGNIAPLGVILAIWRPVNHPPRTR
jgi:hypothetical protein